MGLWKDQCSQSIILWFGVLFLTHRKRRRGHSILTAPCNLHQTLGDEEAVEGVEDGCDVVAESPPGSYIMSAPPLDPHSPLLVPPLDPHGPLPVPPLDPHGPLPVPPLDPHSPLPAQKKESVVGGQGFFLGGCSTEQDIDDVLFSSSILEECALTGLEKKRESESGTSGIAEGGGAGGEVNSHEALFNEDTEDGRFLEALCVEGGGEVVGDVVDQDHLWGLYPEDFSFVMDSSAVLPAQEEQATASGDQETTSCPQVSSRGPVPHSPTTSAVTPHPPPHHHHLTSSPHPPLPFLSSSPATAAGTSGSGRVEYPADTFYGLPSTVQSCFIEYRGISELYGMQACSLVASD